MGIVVPAECYMRNDLGILKELVLTDMRMIHQKHYPDGYRMVFIPSENIKRSEGLQKAFELHNIAAAAKAAESKRRGKEWLKDLISGEDLENLKENLPQRGK